jgi:hypothetical protein
MDKSLVDWYSSYLISRKDKLQSLSRTVVADAFFSKETFITPMCENDFHVISRFRNDVILYYPTLEQKTGKRGHPKWFDGRIDFANLDLTRCKEYEVNKGKLYGLRVYAKAFKRYVSLAVWYPMDGRTDKWQLYFSTDDSMDGREVLDYYRTRFQLEFCFRDGKQHAGITNCQSTDFRKLDFHFNASLAAVNLAKAACKRLGIAYSISSCKSFIHNAYKKAKMNGKPTDMENDWFEWINDINFDLVTRAGITWNNSKYYIGASLVLNTYDYRKSDFSMTNSFGSLRIYAGFNFWKRKEYRQEK